MMAPIPGMSLTKEPGNSPWEQPPLHNTPEEALAFYLDKFDDEETLDDMLFALEAGYPVDAMVDFMTSYSVMEGYHSVDVKMIISPLLHEYIINLADAAGVEYTEELGPSKDERVAAKQKKRTQVLLAKALDGPSLPSEENVAKAEQIVETEAPAEPVVETSPLVQQRPVPTGPFVSRPEAPLSEEVTEPESAIIEELSPEPAPEPAPEPVAERISVGPFVDRKVATTNKSLVDKPTPKKEEPVKEVKKTAPVVKPKPKPKKAPVKKEPEGPSIDLKLGESPVPSHPSIGEVLKGLSIGNHKAVGAPIKAGPYKGQRPLGKYQVMPSNLKSWIKNATEREYSKEEFLNSSEIQTSVAMSAITSLKNEYGSWEDAVSAWFTKRPLSKITNQEEADLVKEKITHFRNGFRRL